jgi:glycine cleavage system transcriptional repressor
MNSWYMVTVIGEDQAGIVSAISRVLFEHDCNLGETSMSRLGGTFTIMMMVNSAEGLKGLESILRPVTQTLGLHLHIDAIRAHMHDHGTTNVQIRVFGADRPGIVAEVTSALAAAGLNILDLDSELAGSADVPVYVMIIDGYAMNGIDQIERHLQPLRASGIDVTLSAVDTMVG